jgi:hypothetical protein
VPPKNSPIVSTIQREYRPRSLRGKTLKLRTHQRRILNEMFKVEYTGSGRYRKMRFKYSTMVYSTIKKEGKTELAAAITYAFARLYGGEMYSIANDEAQAGARMYTRVVESLRMMKEHDPDLFDKIMPDDKRRRERIDINGIVEFADTGQKNTGPHTLQYIASDYAGEAGAMNALVAFDELWGVSSERGERLWTEMQPIHNLEASIRVVTTYAGFYGESALLWRIYENVVKPDPHTNEEHGKKVPGLEDLPVYLSDDGSTIVYWDHEARMPWNTPEALEKARNDPSVQGRESEYRRLWHNEWSSGVEAYIDMDIIDRAIARGRERGLVNNMAFERLGV